MNRREFLKVGTASSIGAGVAGLGARWVASRQDTPIIQDRINTKPNVILIVLDTVRAQSTSLLGYNRQTTPNLSRLARSGVLFTRAFSPACWTLQSHASIFTGKLPFELSADYHRSLDARFPTLAEAFFQAGYQTAGFVANYFYLSREYGLDRGFQHYESHRLTPGLALLTTAPGHAIKYEWRILDPLDRNNTFGRKNARMLRDDFVQWLDRYTSDQPFFAFINFIDAHGPYLPPDQFVTRLTDQPWISHIPNHYNKNKNQKVLDGLRKANDGAIAYLDDQIGKLYEGLKRRGLIDNTLVVITSDHREQFGEHGLLEHGNSMFMQLLHVPLLMLHPSLPPAMSVNEPVSLRDLASTVVDLIKLETNIIFSKNSFAPYLKGISKGAGFVLSESTISYGANHVRAVIDDHLHYIFYESGQEMLFDHSIDPNEFEDLSGNPREKQEMKDLRALTG